MRSALFPTTPKARVASIVVLAVVALTITVAVRNLRYRDTDGPRHETFTVEQCSERPAPDVGRRCEAALESLIGRLRPGDSLAIAPGTYDIGDLRVDPAGDHPEGERITIAARDPARPPLLRGYFRMESPDNVTVSGLRLEATLSEKPAISTACGVGWVVEKSEIFGAAATGNFSNFTLAGKQSHCPDEPRDFVVRDNIFSRPAVVDETDVVVYHHIYASFEGNDETGGVVEGNVFRGMRSGAGVKLGNNGASNVTVSHNTFLNGAYAVLLAYDARDNVVRGNLIVRMSGGPQSAAGSAVAVAQNPDRSNRIEHNYTHRVEHTWREITSRNWPERSQPPTVGPGNVDGPDPRLDPVTLVPRREEATPYGHAGTGSFTS